MKLPPFRNTVLCVGACALVASAATGVASMLRLAEIRLGVEALSRRADEMDAALREERAWMASRLDAIEKDVTDEGSKSRARVKSEIRYLDEHFSRSISEVDGLLSGMSRRMDVFAAREPPSVVAGAGSPEADELESIALGDSKLAGIMAEADRRFAAKDFSGAAERYAVLLKDFPANKEIRRRRAVSLYRSNPADSSKYGLVERDLAAVMAGGPDDAQSIDVLAMISVERQEWDKSLGYFDRLIALFPGDPELLKQAGECAIYAGDKAKATAYLEAAAAAAPGDKAIDALRDRASALADAKAPR
jgi:hypothetical protein